MSTTEQTWGQFRGQNKYFYHLKWQFWQVYLTQILQAYILKLKVSRQKTNFSLDIFKRFDQKSRKTAGRLDSRIGKRS